MSVQRLPIAFERKTALATLAYAAAIAALLAIGFGACATLWQSWTDYSSAAANLEHLRAHKALAGMHFTKQPPAGSAYIEGQTATVAGTVPAAKPDSAADRRHRLGGWRRCRLVRDRSSRRRRGQWAHRARRVLRSRSKRIAAHAL